MERLTGTNTDAAQTYKYSIHLNSIWFKLVQFNAIRLNSKHCLPSTSTWRALHRYFREPGEWMNEFKLSPTLPLGTQVISWSNVTFVESVMSVCERLCVVVCNCGFVRAAFTNRETKLKWHGVCFGDYHHYPSLMLEVIPIALWVICSVPWTPSINTQTKTQRAVSGQINCLVQV